MPKDLEVAPTDLHMSADHMDMHGSELAAAHGAANADIEAAQTGWVGTSGAALRAKFAEWQDSTAKLNDDIAAHGEAFRSAASGYQSVDSDGAAALDDKF